MDTAITIPIGTIKGFKGLHLADLTGEERKAFIDHVNLTRDIIEANQLFETFYFNLLNMRNSLIFRVNDTIKKTSCFPNNANEFIAVNSFIINLISSGQILIEFIRLISKEWLGEDNDIEKHIINLYDSSYIYRLLINLRNYVQHGHLPVSFIDGRYSFDASQILKTEHFNMKPNMKNDLKDFVSKTAIPGETTSCIALTLTIADFTLKIIDSYRKFIIYIKQCVNSSCKKIQKIVDEKPFIVCNYNSEFKGVIFYGSDDGYLQGIDVNDDSSHMMDLFEKRATDIYIDEKQAFDEIDPSHSITN